MEDVPQYNLWYNREGKIYILKIWFKVVSIQLLQQFKESIRKPWQ